MQGVIFCSLHIAMVLKQLKHKVPTGLPRRSRIRSFAMTQWVEKVNANERVDASTGLPQSLAYSLLRNDAVGGESECQRTCRCLYGIATVARVFAPSQ